MTAAPAGNLHSAGMQQQVAEGLMMTTSARVPPPQQTQVADAGSAVPLDWGRLNRMLREAGFSNLALKSTPGAAAGVSVVRGGEIHHL